MNSGKRVRTRFAPSPTGPLHIGGVRTALYNYLLAKKHSGDFILRIEDTDQNRFVPGAEAYIIESLRWCGIAPNEGVGFGDGPHAPYRQSERKAIYRQYAEQLVHSGHAYYAFDKAEDLEHLRKEAEASGSAFAYNAGTRMSLVNSLVLHEAETNERLQKGVPCTIRLRVPVGETVILRDLIRGEVAFSTDEVDDKVLLKSDGMPTYHLAHIVDDVLMEITHAIRGEEWLPSAPAHVLIYRYLGWEEKMPQYAHLPLLLKPEGSGKLSKRDGDRLGFPVFPLEWRDPASGEVSSGYREKGYRPQAVANMLALLGWHPGGDKEILSLEEMASLFDLAHVQHGGARFDPEKARWFNEQYLRASSDSDLAKRIKPLVKVQFSMADTDHRLTDSYLELAVNLMKPRVQFEHEIVTSGSYLFEAPQAYDEEAITKKWNPSFKEFFERLLHELEAKPITSAGQAKEIFESTATQHGLKPGAVLQLFRLFISGQPGGVDLFGMVHLLGPAEVRQRLQHALQNLHL